MRPCADRASRARPSRLKSLAVAAIACACSLNCLRKRPNPMAGRAIRNRRVKKLSSRFRSISLATKGASRWPQCLGRFRSFVACPRKSFECDPELYLFMIEGIGYGREHVGSDGRQRHAPRQDRRRRVPRQRWRWNVRKTSTFSITATTCTSCTPEGSYSGPLFVNPVHGKCLLVLKTGLCARSGQQLPTSPAGSTRLSNYRMWASRSSRAHSNRWSARRRTITLAKPQPLWHSCRGAPRSNPDGLQNLTRKLTKINADDRGRLCRAGEQSDAGSAGARHGAGSASQKARQCAAQDCHAAPGPTAAASRRGWRRAWSRGVVRHSGAHIRPLDRSSRISAAPLPFGERKFDRRIAVVSNRAGIPPHDRIPWAAVVRTAARR